MDEEQFFQLVEIFKKHPRSIAAIRNARNRIAIVTRSERVESEEHQILKQFVASNPSEVLNERGLKTISLEYEFPTGDKADIVLEDNMGRIIGVEIETSVDDFQLEGILQAIKYRYMLALMYERKNEETRAFLVAHSVAKQAKEICDLYEVECFSLDPHMLNSAGKS